MFCYYNLYFYVKVIAVYFFTRILIGMAEKKKHKKHGNYVNEEDYWKPTTDELKVINYLHKNLPSKEGKLHGMIVRIFIAMEAIQVLMNSPWAQPSTAKSMGSYYFGKEQSAINFMNSLLQKQVFQR